jgi:hypothetical protein
MSEVFRKQCGVTDDQQAKCDDCEKVPTWTSYTSQLLYPS